MSSNFNFGLRSLYDTQLRFFQPGLPCYLRIDNLSPDVRGTVGSVAALGFQPTVSGNLSGVTDILIDPPPEVKEVPWRNIGLNLARLRFGARIFTISHTFVANRQALLAFTDPEQVFRDASVQGILYSGRIYNMESVTHEDLAGQPIIWTIIGNAIEVQSQQPLST
jgi:hypothetical protein